MKADPSAFAVLNVSDEGGLRGGRPIVGRVIELDEKRVFRKEFVIDSCRVLDTVHGKIVFAGEFREPSLGGVHKRSVDALAFPKRNGSKHWRFGLASERVARGAEERGEQARAQ